MRKIIAKFEGKAHYSNFNITSRIKQEVQHSVAKELDKKLLMHDKTIKELWDFTVFTSDNLLYENI